MPIITPVKGVVSVLGVNIAPDNGLYGEALPKRGIFSGFSYINEQGNLSLQSVKGPKSAKNRSILWLCKDKKTFWFSYLFNCIRTAVKEMQCPPPGNGVLMYPAD